jgi:methionyl-tRNA formyltransferase
MQPQSVKAPEFARELAALGADLAVVAAYGQILTEEVLATPRLGTVNVHASLLPRYRGAAPVHRSIIDGQAETGVTIMRVVKALDAGPMLGVERMPISLDQTSDEVERDLARLGAALLMRTIDDIVNGHSRETPQDASLATYAPRLTKDDGRVDWSWPALRIHNLIRGLHPWPHATTFAGATRLILHRSHPFPDQSGRPSGTILDASGDRVRVATGEGTLGLLEVQTEGRRPLPAREFLAGHPLAPGTILRPSA